MTYRYKQSSDKQREFRRGILVDKASNIREMMMHLAYWFTAQPHAEKKLPGLEELPSNKLWRSYVPPVSASPS